MTKFFRINVTIQWPAEDKLEAENDLMHEVFNPDSLLFRTVAYDISEMEPGTEIVQEE